MGMALKDLIKQAQNSRLAKAIGNFQESNRNKVQQFNQNNRVSMKVADPILSFGKGMQSGLTGFTGLENRIPGNVKWEPQTRAGQVANFAGGAVGYATGPGKFLNPLEAKAASLINIPTLAKTAPYINKAANFVARKAIPALAAESASGVPTAAIRSLNDGSNFVRNYAENVAGGVAGRGLMKAAGGVKQLVKGGVESVVGKPLAKSRLKVKTQVPQPVVQPRDVRGRFAKMLGVAPDDARITKMANIWSEAKGSLANLTAQKRKVFNEYVSEITNYEPKKSAAFITEISGGDKNKWLPKADGTGLMNTEYAMGAGAGVEPYQDENGEWQVRYSPEKAIAGVAMMGGIKAVKDGKLSFDGNYQRGDIKTLQTRLDDILGTKSFNMTGNWKAELPARKLAKEQLEYYAKQGEPEAKKLLDEVISLEDQLGNVNLAKATQTGNTGQFPGTQSQQSQPANQTLQITKQAAPGELGQVGSSSSPDSIPNQTRLFSQKPFVSERDLPSLSSNPKYLKEQLSEQARIAKEDFKQWERGLLEQENAVFTPRALTTKNIVDVSKTIGEKTVPSYLKPENLPTKDISNIDIGMTDVYRNFDKVFGKNSKATKEILLPFDRSKGQMIDDLNVLAEDLDKQVVKKYNFKKGSRESAAIQQYGEKNRDYASLVKDFGEKKAEDIVEADKWFRSNYDRLLDEVNVARARIYPGQVDKIIHKRNDYYRHFRDLSDSFAGLKNIFDNPAGISPSLAGLSARTKPKSKWLSFAQERLGNKTDEDAIGGFIEYAKAQTYAKNIDPHIEKFRGLGETMAQVMENAPNKSGMNNFIEFLDDFSNDLAGKTNPADRALQKYIGRKPFKVLNWINSRTKANMILGNVSSMIAQIFNVPQGIAEAGIPSATKGIGRTIASVLDANAPIKQSSFIKTRFKDDAFSRFDTGVLNNSKKAAVWMTGVLDQVGTKYIWNSIYDKAIANGIQNPIRYADDITRKMVAGRGIGETPLLQKSKVFQLVAPFQLEVGNIWHVMREWAGEKAAGKFVTFFVVSHILNNIAKEIRGSDVSLDPIQASMEAYQSFKEEDDKRMGALKAGGRLAGEVFSNIPLGQSVAGIYPEYGFKVGETQLPAREEFFGKGDPTRFGSGLLASKGLQDPVFNLLPSYGGQQIKKTFNGLKAYNRGYSESKTGRVRYPIEQSQVNQIKTGLFGEYSTKEAREYFGENRSPLGEQQTEIYKSLPTQQGKEYLKVIDQERKLNSIFDKLEKDEITPKEAESLIGKVSASETTNSLVNSKNTLLQDKMKEFTRKKVRAGMPVSQQELESVYLDKSLQLPKSNKYEKSIRDSKLYSNYSTIESNEDLSAEQKSVLTTKLATELGKSPQDLQRYSIAKENNDAKTMHAYDEIEKSQSFDDTMRFLVNGRKPINGQILVSDGVIDNLVDDGVLTPEVGKDLKGIDLNEDGTLKKGKVKAKSGKKAATARAKAVNDAFEDLKKLTIKPGKIRTSSPGKINTKSLTFSGR